MWRFLWRPRWVISHVLVLALVVAMVNLGLWQLRRLDERRDRNVLVAARLDDRAVPIDEVEDPASDRFRLVEVAGVPAGEIVVGNRTLDGGPGEWHVVDVELASGRHVLVNRGFARIGTTVDRSFTGSATGYLIPRDRLDRTARIDLDSSFDRDGVLQGIVMQTTPEPPEPLIAVPPPDLGDGPHLGYAVQWFIFSAIAIGGYPLVLRRVARERTNAAIADRDDVDRELAELLEAGG